MTRASTACLVSSTCPLLYTRQFRRKVVNNILIGSNPGCGTEGIEPDYGWGPVRPAALCVVYESFQCWLILGSILLGLGSRDTKRSKDDEIQKSTQMRSEDDTGFRLSVMRATDWGCRLSGPMDGLLECIYKAYYMYTCMYCRSRRNILQPRSSKLTWV